MPDRHSHLVVAVGSRPTSTCGGAWTHQPEANLFIVSRPTAVDDGLQLPLTPSGAPLERLISIQLAGVVSLADSTHPRSQATGVGLAGQRHVTGVAERGGDRLVEKIELFVKDGLSVDGGDATEVP